MKDLEVTMSERMTEERLKKLEPLFRKWGIAYNEIRQAGLECLEEISACWKEREKDREAMELAERVLVELRDHSWQGCYAQDISALAAISARLEEK